MPASLQDIASALNVSVSLVSKVLNGRMGTTGVTQETMEAIRKQAIEVGYIKNRSAAALRAGKQSTIGLYVHHHGTWGSGITEALVMGMANAAKQAGQRLLLSYYADAAEFSRLSAEITPALMDGLIVAGILHAEIGPVLAQITQEGLPVVTVLSAPIHPKVPNIDLNQEEVGELATTHLIEQGCRKIAHIKVGEERYRGYVRALTHAGLAVDPSLVYTAEDYTLEQGKRAVRAFMAKRAFFDGIVAQSDQSAAGALYTVMGSGKRVPQDVKIVGVDNSPYCDLLVVPLTSVSQEDGRRGEVAARLLLAQLAGDESLDVPSVSPVLMVRASSVNGEPPR